MITLLQMEFELSNKKVVELTKESDGVWMSDGKALHGSLLPLSGHEFHLLKDGVSYRIHVESSDVKQKSFDLVVNGRRISLRARDKFESLLESLGMDALAGSKAKDLKAPMPGLVIDIPVTKGQEIASGDSLIILEAMKMENVIKAESDGVVKDIKVSSSDSVEKNQVLITFED